MSFSSISERVPTQVNRPHQFSYESGILITHAEPGLVRGELTVNENSYNPHGIVHGGLLTTLAPARDNVFFYTIGNTMDHALMDEAPEPPPPTTETTEPSPA